MTRALPTKTRWQRGWTESEIATLRRMRSDGYTYDEIAHTLSRSERSVAVKAHKLRCKTKRRSDAADLRDAVIVAARLVVLSGTTRTPEIDALARKLAAYNRHMRNR